MNKKDTIKSATAVMLIDFFVWYHMYISGAVLNVTHVTQCLDAFFCITDIVCASDIVT